MSKKQFQLDLLTMIQDFETDYKEKIDPLESHDYKTFEVLYDSGAVVKHAFDKLEEILVKYIDVD